jgi:16S rRNA (cytosine1402-N4)-methyltransferase
MSYHVPVLLKESIEHLNIQPDGVYVDVTFGGGGHSKAILQQLNTDGQLFGFDQDEDAATQSDLKDTRFTFIASNFRHLKSQLRVHGVRTVDGILADLGVSSYQFDTAERGFSYRFDADLDMRMNRHEDRTAADVLNHYQADELQAVFSEFGEVRNSRTLAHTIVKMREQKPLRTIQDLLAVVEPLIIGGRAKYLAQLFQALRIEVNDEMGALKEFLKQSLEILNPDGRLVILTYHSIEDRYVKNFFKTGDFDGKITQDMFGKITRPFELVIKKPLEPSAEEMKLNSRAHSGKLRVVKPI